jgi:hypothetical protein
MGACHCGFGLAGLPKREPPETSCSCLPAAMRVMRAMRAAQRAQGPHLRARGLSECGMRSVLRRCCFLDSKKLVMCGCEGVGHNRGFPSEMNFFSRARHSPTPEKIADGVWGAEQRWYVLARFEVSVQGREVNLNRRAHWLAPPACLNAFLGSSTQIRFSPLGVWPIAADRVLG